MGFESIHVNGILDKSATKDSDLCKYADFRNSYFVNQTPKKLIKINLGNIPNQDLIRIFTDNIGAIQKLDSKLNFLLEIDSDDITLIET